MLNGWRWWPHWRERWCVHVFGALGWRGSESCPFPNASLARSAGNSATCAQSANMGRTRRTRGRHGKFVRFYDYEIFSECVCCVSPLWSVLSLAVKTINLAHTLLRIHAQAAEGGHPRIR